MRRKRSSSQTSTAPSDRNHLYSDTQIDVNEIERELLSRDHNLPGTSTSGFPQPQAYISKAHERRSKLKSALLARKRKSLAPRRPVSCDSARPRKRQCSRKKTRQQIKPPVDVVSISSQKRDESIGQRQENAIGSLQYGKATCNQHLYKSTSIQQLDKATNNQQLDEAITSQQLDNAIIIQQEDKATTSQDLHNAILRPSVFIPTCSSDQTRDGNENASRIKRCYRDSFSVSPSSYRSRKYRKKLAPRKMISWSSRMHRRQRHYPRRSYTLKSYPISSHYCVTPSPYVPSQRKSSSHRHSRYSKSMTPLPRPRRRSYSRARSLSRRREGSRARVDRIFYAELTSSSSHSSSPVGRGHRIRSRYRRKPRRRCSHDRPSRSRYSRRHTPRLSSGRTAPKRTGSKYAQQHRFHERACSLDGPGRRYQRYTPRPSTPRELPKFTERHSTRQPRSPQRGRSPDGSASRRYRRYSVRQSTSRARSKRAEKPARRYRSSDANLRQEESDGLVPKRRRRQKRRAGSSEVLTNNRTGGKEDGDHDEREKKHVKDRERVRVRDIDPSRRYICRIM